MYIISKFMYIFELYYFIYMHTHKDYNVIYNIKIFDMNYSDNWYDFSLFYYMKCVQHFAT